jgi:hypothetical protein
MDRSQGSKTNNFIPMPLRYIIFLIAMIPALLLPYSCNNARSGDAGANKPVDKIPVKFSLEDLQKRTFLFFWNETDSVSGLMEDRAPTKAFCSTASTGFGLTAYIVGVENGYVTRSEAAARVLKLFKFLWQLRQGTEMSGIGGYKGFFYHFLDMRTGLRFRNIELSSIDTAWLIAGILSCMSYFDGSDPVETGIRSMADSLYCRVDWDWFMNGRKAMSMGWFPDKGFLKAEWVGYNEAMALIIMAMGSPTHPIPESSWDEWTRPYVWDTYYGFEHVNFGPLFGHQYSQMYIDFRGITDKYMAARGIDYFENSRCATYANRAYCIENPKAFKDYGENIWGLTACDGPGGGNREINGNTVDFMGYSARGASIDYKVDDGTIAPTAAGGSIPFAPEICLPALEAMYDKYGEKLYGEYGFRDAFNPTFTFGKGNESGWFDPDYIGIDQGTIILQIANYRDGLVWNIMKKNPYIIAGLKKAGFKGGWLDKAE